MIRILPVVHHLNIALSHEQIDLAFEVGADGVFVISHDGDDTELMDVIIEQKKAHPERYIGVNFLSMHYPVRAYNVAATTGADAVWLDNAGVDSTSIELGQYVAEAKRARAGNQHIFASVAFKYQAPEPDPVKAAVNALSLGFIPTTSGPGTGQAPEVQKIIDMSAATNGILGIASGMTPENVELYAPHLSHILVATGVSQDMHHFDYEKLMVLVAKAKWSSK